MHFLFYDFPRDMHKFTLLNPHLHISLSAFFPFCSFLITNPSHSFSTIHIGRFLMCPQRILEDSHKDFQKSENFVNPHADSVNLHAGSDKSAFSDHRKITCMHLVVYVLIGSSINDIWDQLAESATLY